MPSNPALMIIDVQPSFSPPAWLVTGISALIGTMPSIATIERHDEQRTPFQRQLGWAPGLSDDSLVAAGRIFVKHGYLPPPHAIEHLVALRPSRVLVCGVQARYLRARRRLCAVRCGPAPDASDRSCCRILDRPIGRSGRKAVAPPLQACRDQP